MIITGIGSRQTPIEVLGFMHEIGREVNDRRWWIRSGHAEGADYAFEVGAKEQCVVYLPWNNFNSNLKLHGKPCVNDLDDKVLDMVYHYEPHVKDRTDGVKRIKSRNVYQVLGSDLKSPSRVVICYTDEGKLVGGTALALKIAMDHNIDIINLGDPNVESRINEILREL